MKKIKLLMPILGFSALATIVMPLTSCGNGGGSEEGTTVIKPTTNVTHGTITYTTIKLNNSFTITYTPEDGYELSTVTIKVDNVALTQGTDYTISGNVITVKASAVTSSTISISIIGSKSTSGSAKVITSDTTLSSGSFKSTSSDENAVLVNGNGITANLSNLTLNKTGDCSKTEDSSFYGTNSALLAKGGSTVKLSNLNVTTNASGANGVFAYGGKSSTQSETGDGTNITISDSTINTTLGNSGGIMVAGHASLTASNCTVTTQGDSSAAIRSDRGGDTMTVTGGTYTSNGKGSPAIYATATINVNNASLKSTTSEGVIVEGSNNVTLTGCTLEDTNCKHNSDKSSEFKNIFLYQSQSGDAGSGKDSFTATNCTIKTHQGDDFFVTNQTSTITLKNNNITNDWSATPSVTQKPYFLRAKADGWGTSGKNGGNVTLIFDDQDATGEIYVDSISTLAWTLKNGSTYEGTINADNCAKTLTISATSGCSIKLTGNSYVTSTPDSTTLSCINVGNYHLYLNDGTKIK